MDRVRNLIGLSNPTKGTFSGRDFTIAVLDSGMSLHPDLDGSLLVFRDFVDNRKKPYDDLGHGTHICGIMCGNGWLSNGRYRGIVPNCNLAVGKVLNERGDGLGETLSLALDWIREIHKKYDIRILNISLGSSGMNRKDTEKELLEQLNDLWKLGILVVVSAGNKGPKEGSISRLSLSESVISVGCHDGETGSIGNGHSCAFYSGRGERRGGPAKPDLVAPGTDIVSCNAFYHSGGMPYTKMSGTSMSTPIVSGCGALLWKKYPYLSNDQIKERMKYTAKDLGEPWNLQGWGMIRADRLLG